MKTILIIILLDLFMVNHVFSQNIDLKTAETYFAEIKEVIAEDNGKLWGKTLEGPFMFVDQKTNEIVANCQDKESTLIRSGNVYTGKLENEVSIANTSVEWHGERWIMVIWQLIPENKYDRISLFMHESWHRIQKDIGFPGLTNTMEDINNKESRSMIRMEWKALTDGIKNNDKDRIKDALIFRYMRKKLFSKTYENATLMEMHEGLAEYTGKKLSKMPLDTALYRTIVLAKSIIEKRRYDWSYAYVAGSLYGVLLDQYSKDWIKDLKPEADFGMIVQKYLDIQLPADLKKAYKQILVKYDGKKIIEDEDLFENNLKKLKESYQEILVKQSVLICPNNGIQISFNPGKMISIKEGVVYEELTAKAKWGILTVSEGGALMYADWSKIQVSKPSKIGNSFAEGRGWKLELMDGWKIEKEGKNFIIVKL